MENISLTIKPNIGLGDLEFDMPIEKVIALWGESSELQTIENAVDEATLVLNYEERGCTLVFEGFNPKLTYIDILDDSMTLFGEEIIDKNEEEIIKLMESNNYTEYSCENEDWGEKSLSFEKANIDFFFENNELISVAFNK